MNLKLEILTIAGVILTLIGIVVIFTSIAEIFARDRKILVSHPFWLPKEKLESHEFWFNRLGFIFSMSGILILSAALFIFK